MDNIWQMLESIIQQYDNEVKIEFKERMAKWPVDLMNRHIYEVIGGLLARQITLATELGRNPGIWNGHIAPMILRTMVDTYISIAWILKSPIERSRLYILYGLGQEKLNIEHLKAGLKSKNIKPDDVELVQIREEWLNLQRYSFLTEVNVGSWSGINTRAMAEEAGVLSLYNYAYLPFSASTHSMWHHVGRYNLSHCKSPLHMNHLLPFIPSDHDTDFDYFFKAAKYVDRTFSLFDESYGIKITEKPALETVKNFLIEQSAKDSIENEN